LDALQIMESLHFCQKLTILNFLEVDKYKIFGLKRSQLNKCELKKNFNVLKENPEKVQNGLTAGRNYMLQNQETTSKSESSNPSSA